MVFEWLGLWMEEKIPMLKMIAGLSSNTNWLILSMRNLDSNC